MWGYCRDESVVRSARLEFVEAVLFRLSAAVVDWLLVELEVEEQSSVEDELCWCRMTGVVGDVVVGVRCQVLGVVPPRASERRLALLIVELMEDVTIS